jgi:pimeloyl-ACP methyl ester carboxylesterase
LADGSARPGRRGSETAEHVRSGAGRRGWQGRRWPFVLLALGLGLALAFWPVHRRLRAAALFLRFEGGAGAPAWLVHYGEYQVDVAPANLPSGTAALLYAPRGLAGGAGMVLAHGIHEDGIHEQRMVRLARALASTGLFVLTPELVDLAHYRITHAGAETIAEAARALGQRLSRPRVSVFGISFGGGLAVRAACEPRLRDPIDAVIGLGAHHDAQRVTRFILGEPALGPDGERADVTPHPYGAAVLFQSLFGERHRGQLRDDERARLATALAGRAEELRQASPSGCQDPPRVPLHLVHGLADGIVPFTESLWNARQFSASTRVELLISPVLGHAEYSPPTLRERLELVAFMAELLP